MVVSKRCLMFLSLQGAGIHLILALGHRGVLVGIMWQVWQAIGLHLNTTLGSC